MQATWKKSTHRDSETRFVPFKADLFASHSRKIEINNWFSYKFFFFRSFLSLDISIYLPVTKADHFNDLLWIYVQNVNANRFAPLHHTFLPAACVRLLSKNSFLLFFSRLFFTLSVSLCDLPCLCVLSWRSIVKRDLKASRHKQLIYFFRGQQFRMQ